MGCTSSDSLPSKTEVENQHKLNNKNNNYKTIGQKSNVQNDNIQNMAPPPIKGQNLPNRHPIDESLNNDTPNEEAKNNNSSNMINRPTQSRQNKPQSQSGLQPHPQNQLLQQNPNNINNLQPIQMGVAGPYIQQVGVPIGYQVPYYAPGQLMYPSPYYGPQPLTNTAIVFPPGYKPDYDGGYSPWGNFDEDIRNLF